MRKPNALELFSVAIIASACLPAAYANRTGALPGRTGSPASAGVTCRDCHGKDTGGGSVQIVGVPTAYEPDAVYELIVRISDPDQAGAGFEISVEDPVGVHAGTLIRSDTTNTRFAGGDSGFITHSGTGVNNAVANWAALGNAAEYHVQWRAPATDIGPVTFWAAGNAINDDGTPFGDRIYLANVTISAETPACPGDVDGDGTVNISDLGTLLSNFGITEGASREDGDLNGDGAVNITDLGEVLANFNNSCGP